MLNDQETLAEATAERRGFLGWIGAMVAGAAEAVSLVGQKNERPAKAWEEEINHARDEYDALQDEYERIRDGQVLGASRDSQAARIIREHGLQPARYGRGPEWFVQSSLTPWFYESGDGWKSYYWASKSDNGDLLYWDDPVEALIEAEPLYLEWKARQQRFKGFAVGHYHVDSQDGLNALAETIRQVAAEAAEKTQLVEVPA